MKCRSKLFRLFFFSFFFRWKVTEEVIIALRELLSKYHSCFFSIMLKKILFNSNKILPCLSPNQSITQFGTSMNRPLRLYIRWDGGTSVAKWKDLWAWLPPSRYWNMCLKLACLAGERRVLLARENLKGKDGALFYSLRRVAIKVRSNCWCRFFLHFPAELCRQDRSSELWWKCDWGWEELQWRFA